ncbi:trap dicarboxylate transporter, dctq subunit, unknown substrate 6 [hydrocarbon metagenome]|uniref:Tripartite ATP-independent periplasmic transporters DctQ component domain-containing protein n=1 Tax=hydrocarbon metagenome TaxID=938273 RepID=A0A0W8G058_9ZZZZ
MNKIADKIDAAIEKIGRSVSWLTLILVLLVCYDVISRYLFKSSIVAIQELQWHLFAIIFLVAAAYTLKYDEHVRVDVLYSKFSPRTQAVINLIGTIIFLIPFCLLIVYASRNFVFSSFQIGETSPDPGGLPARYILKAILPFSFFLILLQGIALILRSIIQIKSFGKGEL